MVKLSGWLRRRIKDIENATIDAYLSSRRRGLFSNPRSFEHSRSRVRMDWEKRLASLTDAEFKRTYRMSKETFNMVLEKIRSEIEAVNPNKARGDLHGPVPAELVLSMTLRYLAGGSYLDIYQMHGVGRSTLFAAIPVVCKAIVATFPLSFPIDDEAALVLPEHGLIAD
jgi:hypothetical protein